MAGLFGTSICIFRIKQSVDDRRQLCKVMGGGEGIQELSVMILCHKGVDLRKSCSYFLNYQSSEYVTVF